MPQAMLTAPIRRWTAVAVVIPALVLPGCRSTAASTPAAEPQRPLSAWAGRRVVLLPSQTLDDGAGWATGTQALSSLRVRMDDELAFALGERGLQSRWIFPEELAKLTRRAGGYVPDVKALTVEQLRRKKEVPDGPLADPLASQLRALVAFTDARWVLLPVETRVERSGDGARVVVQVAMIDARGATVAWMGDVAGDTAPSSGAAAFASAASRVGDLIAPGS
jgi:hypothetical protein